MQSWTTAEASSQAHDALEVHDREFWIVEYVAQVGSSDFMWHSTRPPSPIMPQRKLPTIRARTVLFAEEKLALAT